MNRNETQNTDPSTINEPLETENENFEQPQVVEEPETANAASAPLGEEQ